MAVGVSVAIAEVAKLLRGAIKMFFDPRLQRGRKSVRRLKRLEKSLDVAEQYILVVRKRLNKFNDEEKKELEKLEKKFFKYN